MKNRICLRGLEGDQAGVRTAAKVISEVDVEDDEDDEDEDEEEDEPLPKTASSSSAKVFTSARKQDAIAPSKPNTYPSSMTGTRRSKRGHESI